MISYDRRLGGESTGKSFRFVSCVRSCVCLRGDVASYRWAAERPVVLRGSGGPRAARARALPPLSAENTAQNFRSPIRAGTADLAKSGSEQSAACITTQCVLWAVQKLEIEVWLRWFASKLVP